MMTLAEKLARNSREDAQTGCVLWTAAKNRDGYGVVLVGSRKDGTRRMMLAHRASWAERGEPLPVGMILCHRCDTPACINPAHLFIGTVAVNNADMRAKQRHARGAAHGLAKLTGQQVRDIRSAAGRRGLIASNYGISANHVGAIKRREKWAHIQ